MDNAFSVSEFLSVVNQTLDYAYPKTYIVGEVSSFKVNQNKWVFFDLKDDQSTLSCFMPLSKLRTEITDGMKVAVVGYPRVTKWGRFSFTIKNIQPIGEGNIKKAFELLKKKLEREGLFAPEKKRPLPSDLTRIGVISSTQAAGYADFIKIINERWGGLTIQVAHTGVQGLQAADQIIRALKYFNEQRTVQVIAIIRGGGSADDLAVFNDEQLVRAIAASRIPVITGIGHEVDESLADLAADLYGSTPSNVAQILTPDRHEVAARVNTLVSRLHSEIDDQIRLVRSRIDIAGLKRTILDQLDRATSDTATTTTKLTQTIHLQLSHALSDISEKIKLISHLDPDIVLKQGYAILKGKLAPGETIEITTHQQLISATINHLKERH